MADTAKEVSASTRDSSSEEGAAHELWRLWQQGHRPDVRDFVARSGELTPVDLANILRVDQRLRWKRGERVFAEEYFQAFPALTTAVDQAIDLIYAEFLLRQELGESPSAQEYQQRFPLLDPHLQRQLELDEAIQDLAKEQTSRLTTSPLDSEEDRSEADTLTPETGHAKTDPAQWPLVSGYEILSWLGEGGMGVVYKARQVSLRRTVALKVIRKKLLLRPQAINRFLREAQAAAALLHSHIVIIYDAGRTQDTYYYSMEFVEGIDLARLMKQGPMLEVAQVCNYMRQAALGLQHAYERGLVHRDIKPGNLIVSPAPQAASLAEDRDLPFRGAVLKILDMGLARLDQLSDLSSPPVAKPAKEIVMGTPDYMAPEQWLNPHRVDIRADLYSLGCTAYHLLAGRPPFAGADWKRKRQRHLSDEATSIAHLCPEVPSDVSAVIHRLMAKDAEDRYQTPADLAEELEPWCEAEEWSRSVPRAAKPPSSMEIRMDSFIEPIKRRSAERYKRQATLVRQFEGHQDWVWAVALSGDGRRALSGSKDATVRLWDVETGNAVACLEGHEAEVVSVAFSLDGRRALSGSIDKTVRLWDLESGREVRVFRGHTDNVVSVGFSGDGSQTLSASRDGTIRICDLESGGEARRIVSQMKIVGLAFSSDGHTALGTCIRSPTRLLPVPKNTVRLWALESGRELRRFEGHADLIWSVALSPDGRRALSGSEDNTVRLWELDSGQEIFRLAGHTGWSWSVAFSPDGRRALSGSDDKTLRLWDLEKSIEMGRLEGHTDWVSCVVFAPDGRTALSGSNDRTLRLWRLPDR